MDESTITFVQDRARFEVMPLGRSEEQAAQLPHAVRLTVTCSPRRHKLLEMSVRIGVGPSLAFVRKQRGLRSLLSRRSTADRMYKELAPMLDDPQLDIAGFHYFTFNQLIQTYEWWERKQGARPAHSNEPAASGVYVHRDQGATP